MNHANENKALENTNFADKQFLYQSTNLKAHVVI